MKPLFFVPLLTVFSCLFSGTTAASDIPKMIYDKPPLARIDLAKVKGFAATELELQGLIARRNGDTTIANHFCIIGYQFSDRQIEANVIWKEKNWLIRWWGSNDIENTHFKWFGSLAVARSIDMNTNLVNEEFTGSTFLVSRPEAETAVADCEVYGKQYTITPFFPTDGEGDCFERVNPENHMVYSDCEPSRPIPRPPGLMSVGGLPNMMYKEAPLARIDLSEYEQFNVLDIELEMQGLIADYGNTEISNHFCVIGYRLFNLDREAHIIWKEKNWLIRWNGRTAIYNAMQLDFSEIRSLARTRPIDMNTDLVETPADRRGKKFLTLRAGAEAAVANCEAYGKQYSITPFVPPDDDCKGEYDADGVLFRGCRPFLHPSD